MKWKYKLYQVSCLRLDVGFISEQKFMKARISWPLMQILRLSKVIPILLVRLQSNAHLVELHNRSVCTNSVSGPFCTDSNEEICFVLVFWQLEIIIFQDWVYSLVSHDVIAHVCVHLLVCGHHVGDPTWFTYFKRFFDFLRLTNV